MKKRLFCFLLVGILVLGMVSGCGKKENDTSKTDTKTKVEQTGGEKETSKDKKKEQVNLKMTVFGSQGDEAIYRERLDLVEKTFDHIKVELVYIPKDYSTKVQSMIAGGTPPDIMQLSEDVHSYSALQQILPLDDYVNTNGIDLEKRFGTAYTTYAYKGQQYAMPDRGGTMLVYYNKDMFDDKGVAYPTSDWTWDDLLEAAQKLTVRNGDDVEVYGFAAGDWWPWWMSFIYQNGGRVLDDNNKVVINSPETVEALQFYNDLVYKHKVAPSLEDFANMGNTGPDPLFAQGKVAFQITGFWNIGSLNKVPDLNWDIAPLWKNKENATVAFGSGLAISRDCKYPEEAFQVIEYLTSVDGQMPILTNKQDAPANKELLASDAFMKADFAKHPINMKAFQENADAVMKLPLGPHWNELTKVCGDNLDELLMNRKDAASVVEEIQKDLENMMSRY